MTFEFIDHQQKVSDEDLIRDVQSTAQKLGKNTLTATEYSEYGTHHSATLRKRFGSWKKVLKLSPLETHEHNYKIIFADEDVIADLKRVAHIVESETLFCWEYRIHGKYSANTLINRYGSWNKILSLAGMKINCSRNFSNEEMFKEIERNWIMLGRQPTSTDIKNGISKFSLQSYARRFGGRKNALQEFIAFINSSERCNKRSCDGNISKGPNVAIPLKTSSRHKTPRDFNLKLRFQVMKRDNFRCCACGASPASTPGVELHIDHIVPWSKGGETILENLQTLCSKCNLGKIDN